MCRGAARGYTQNTIRTHAKILLTYYTILGHDQNTIWYVHKILFLASTRILFGMCTKYYSWRLFKMCAPNTFFGCAKIVLCHNTIFARFSDYFCSHLGMISVVCRYSIACGVTAVFAYVKVQWVTATKMNSEFKK